MSVKELKIKVREILIANPDMLVSLDIEFGRLLLNPDFNYREDEFLFWMVDCYFEMENGQENYIFN